MKVFIDPGHGGFDFGFNYKNKFFEKNDNLKFSLALLELLTLNNINCMISRIDDNYISLEKRISLANNFNADYFISIHRSGSDLKKYGCRTFINTNSGVSEILYANYLNSAISCFFINNGIFKGKLESPYKNYMENEKTNMHSCLLQIGYITSEIDNKIFNKYFEKIVMRIAKVFINLDNQQFKK